MSNTTHPEVQRLATEYKIPRQEAHILWENLNDE